MMADKNVERLGEVNICAGTDIQNAVIPTRAALNCCAAVGKANHVAKINRGVGGEIDVAGCRIVGRWYGRRDGQGVRRAMHQHNNRSNLSGDYPKVDHVIARREAFGDEAISDSLFGDCFDKKRLAMTWG
jgi:hypothetical protein